MPVDPQVQVFLDQMASLNGPPMHSQTPPQVRAGIRMQLGFFGEPEPIAQVDNRVIPGPAGQIPIRIYTPAGSGPFPVLVFLHGGGWVICDLDTHDGLCRSLANGAGCVVVSVDYRLAPEHKFPAAPHDCYAAAEWVAGHAAEVGGDPSRIAIGGDSAGGNLAAVVAQMARDQHGPLLIFQMLIYPATQFGLKSRSIEENAEGYYLTREDMDWFMGHYLTSDADKANPLASPMLAASLKGLPPAFILTAEYDPLRDEGEAYGHKLEAAGVPVKISRHDGMIHGFLSMAVFFDGGKRGIEDCCRALRAAFT